MDQRIVNSHPVNDLILNDHDWLPKPVPYFQPHTIVLVKGSRTTESRKRLVANICALYPNAEILEQEDVSHSKVTINGRRLIDRHYRGKQTLVLGEMNDCVRFSEESGNSCPNYWHFSPYSFCPYGCHYCYLAGTMGIKFSPAVKIFVNLAEILHKIDRIANRIGKRTSFYLGKLQDGIALDPLTNYSRIMIPFFANHPYARLTVLTKSTAIDNLLLEKHNGHVILSWSLNPTSICDRFEPNTPSLEDRLIAMRKCAQAGYPIRAMLMPLIPIENWQEQYSQLIDKLMNSVSLQRITMGGVCSYKTALSLMNQKLTKNNPLNRNMEEPSKRCDGRIRYSSALRIEMYSFLLQCIRKHDSNMTVSLCMEEMDIVRTVGLSKNVGQCICPL